MSGRIYSDLDILSDKIGDNKILIVTESELVRKELNPVYHNFSWLQKNTLGMSLEDLGQPFLFVTDGDLISHLYAPELLESSRAEYFLHTLPNYFN